MGWMRAGEGANISDATLLIEAAEDGWWYTTLLPGERLLAAFMTSPPLAAREAGPLARYWADQMERTQHVRRRAAGFVLEGDVCVKPASSCACHPVAGERWLAVGDAAMAFDPLSSMGISKALRMGLAAADVIQQFCGGYRRSRTLRCRGWSGVHGVPGYPQLLLSPGDGWPIGPFGASGSKRTEIVEGHDGPSRQISTHGEISTTCLAQERNTASFRVHGATSSR